MTEATQVLVKSLPETEVKADQFECVTTTLPSPKAGQVLLQVMWLSLDPYMRGVLSGRHILGPIHPGDVMVGETVCRVLDSKSPDFAKGDIVCAFTGWVSHAVMDAKDCRPAQTFGLQSSLALGVLGMPGLTAYAGVKRLLEPRAGEVMLVSAGTGSVGATVGQLGRLVGCKTIAIAGGPFKAAWATGEAGYDAAIDYKSEDIRTALKRLAPNGIDLYFDNVGGDMLQAAMENLAIGARVVMCGLMGQYNDPVMPPGPNPAYIIKARAKVMGLVVYDHEDMAAEAREALADAIRGGDMTFWEDINDGLEKAPKAFARLMKGDNCGKALVRVSA